MIYSLVGTTKTILIFSFISIFLALLGPKVYAATVNYYVDPLGTNDLSHGTGPGTNAWATIQYAVTNVANPTTAPIYIHVAAGTYILGNDDILIDRNFTNLVIDGSGATTTIIKPHADPASVTSRNIDIGATENVTLSNMTIRDGYISGASGPGIRFSSGNLTLRNVLVDDNDAPSSFT